MLMNDFSKWLKTNYNGTWYRKIDVQNINSAYLVLCEKKCTINVTVIAPKYSKKCIFFLNELMEIKK